MKTVMRVFLLFSFGALHCSVSEYNKNLIQQVIYEQKMQGYGIEICSDDILPHIEFVGPHVTKATLPIIGSSVPLTIGLPLCIGSMPARIYINQYTFDALTDSQKKMEIRHALADIKKSRKRIIAGTVVLICGLVLYEVGKECYVYYAK